MTVLQQAAYSYQTATAEIVVAPSQRICASPRHAPTTFRFEVFVQAGRELEALLAKLIGARIRELRKARGWTQLELAERVGSWRAIVSRVERGGHVQSLANIYMYADALEVHPREILKAIDHVRVAT